MGWNIDALIRMGTHCKAGEDVCSCSHANADHAVDPAEEPMVTEGLERNSQFMHVIIDQPSTRRVTHLSWVITEGNISANSSMVG